MSNVKNKNKVPKVPGSTLDKSLSLNTTHEFFEDSSLMFRKILDEVPSSITVIDSETFNVLFANKNALEATKDMPGKYIGSVCYEYIHGLKCPCDHCIMLENEQSDSCRDVFYHGKTYHQDFKIIEWNGKRALLEFTEDVTQQQETKEKLNQANAEIYLSSQHAGILFWTYNIKKHQTTIISGKSLGYDTVIDNVPEVFRNTKGVHPEDIDSYFYLFEQMKQGVPSCECEARIYDHKDDSYQWQHLIFLKQSEDLYLGSSINIHQQKINELYAKNKGIELDRILNLIPAGVVVYQFKNGVFSIANINQTLCELFNIDSKKINSFNSQQLLDFTDPEFQDTVRSSMKDLLVPGSYREWIIKTSIKRGNQNIWVKVLGRSIAYDQEIIHIYATYYDITQEKKLKDEKDKASEELKQKYELEKARYISDSKVLAFGCFNLTKNTVIDEVRVAPLDALEKSLNFESFILDISKDIYNEKQRKMFFDFYNLDNLLKNKDKEITEDSIEFQRKLSSGKIIWVKSTYKLFVEPSNSELLLLYSCKDIHLQKLTELVTAYLADTDYDLIGHIDFFDNKALLLYGNNNLEKPSTIDKSFIVIDFMSSLKDFVNQLIVKEEKEYFQSELFIEQLKDGLKNNNKFDFLCHIIDRNGVKRTKKIQYTKDASMDNSCFVTETDVTDLLEEQELQRTVLKNALDSARLATKTKSDFFSRMSHDMRTPMNGILGMVNISKDETDVKVLKENINKIGDSGKYLLGLINDSLDYQRIDAGKLKIEPQIISANSMLDDIFTMIKATAGKKNINFKFDKGNTDINWLIRADPLRLKQIFINLLSNAVKFTPENGSVELKLKLLSREGLISHNLITISDTGIGMSKDFLKNGIFMPFSQERNDMSSMYAGSGLGLSIVKRLIEMMGGRIEVESELGSGTTFLVYLDFIRVEDSTAKEELETKQNTTNTDFSVLKNVKILLAEDHPLNAEIATKLLEKEGCKITWAKNGLECLNMFKKNPQGEFDIILMDIRMPVMDGLTAAKEIRKLARSDAKKIPILAMTANAYEDDIQKSLEVGMNAHLAKPIEPEKMYNTLIKFLEK